jgi:hypothetical protein
VVEQVDQQALLGRRHAGDAHRRIGDRRTDSSAIWDFVWGWWWESRVGGGAGRIYKRMGMVVSPLSILFGWCVYRDSCPGPLERSQPLDLKREGDTPHAGRFILIVGAQ